MAELVDALVSNTSGFTSMPVRSRLWVQEEKLSVNNQALSFFILSIFSPHFPYTCKICGTKVGIFGAEQDEYSTFEMK